MNWFTTIYKGCKMWLDRFAGRCTGCNQNHRDCECEGEDE